MARLHLGGVSASSSGAVQCPLCGTYGLGIGVPCEHCGASVDQTALELQEEEQLGQTRMLADRTAPHLVRPL
eukprot:104834-Alexandrium_andersonii.AAC.1